MPCGGESGDSRCVDRMPCRSRCWVGDAGVNMMPSTPTHHDPNNAPGVGIAGGLRGRHWARCSPQIVLQEAAEHTHEAAVECQCSVDGQAQSSFNKLHTTHQMARRNWFVGKIKCTVGIFRHEFEGVCARKGHESLQTGPSTCEQRCKAFLAGYEVLLFFCSLKTSHSLHVVHIMLLSLLDLLVPGLDVLLGTPALAPARRLHQPLSKKTACPMPLFCFIFCF